MNEPDNHAYGASLHQADAGADARWMTFTELAKARDITKLSAVALVRRHGWRRQRDNQGHMTALVPLAWAQPEPLHEADNQPEEKADNRADTASFSASFETALSAIEAAHASEVAALRAQADASEQARIGIQTLADQALAQLADAGRTIEQLRATVDRAEATSASERQRADALRDRLNAMREQLADAHAALQAAAEAGARTERAERDKERAEQARDAERTRADALRTTIDELNAGQALMVDMHARELAAAQHDAQQATETAAALTRDEIARQARGRLRRAWDGWQGR